MSWNLLTKEELIQINKEVMAEEGKSSAVLKESALSEAVEGVALEYAQSLEEAAYAVAVAISQSHPFEDGNKRTASKAVQEFFKRNDRPLTAGEFEAIQELVGALADDDPMEKEEFIDKLDQLLSARAKA